MMDSILQPCTRVEPGSGPHGEKLMCNHCGKFIRWLPKRLQTEDKPATEAQLQYLKKLGFAGTPANRLEASEAIDGLIKRRN